MLKTIAAFAVRLTLALLLLALLALVGILALLAVRGHLSAGVALCVLSFATAAVAKGCCNPSTEEAD